MITVRLCRAAPPDYTSSVFYDCATFGAGRMYVTRD
jgi:hypothetical protein